MTGRIHKQRDGGKKNEKKIHGAIEDINREKEERKERRKTEKMRERRSKERKI